MSLSIITGFISGIFKPAAKLIDDLHTSEEEKLVMKAKLMEIEKASLSKAMDLEGQIIEAKKEIIVAEAKGSWLQRSWRPVLMWVIILIIANNFVLAPYLNAFMGWSIMLELPAQLYSLLTVGVGGYVAGRSAEKVVDKWKK
jgi:hypothetical protein